VNAGGDLIPDSLRQTRRTMAHRRGHVEATGNARCGVLHDRQVAAAGGASIAGCVASAVGVERREALYADVAQLTLRIEEALEGGPLDSFPTWNESTDIAVRVRLIASPAVQTAWTELDSCAQAIRVGCLWSEYQMSDHPYWKYVEVTVDTVVRASTDLTDPDVTQAVVDGAKAKCEDLLTLLREEQGFV
jgi:hypothetical protein